MGVNPNLVKLLKMGALGLLILALGAGVGTILVSASSAQEQPAEERTAALEANMQRLAVQEMRSGQLADTSKGRVFIGETAAKMDRAHEQAQQQYDKIVARPDSERQAAIASIRAFAKNPAAQVVYQSTMKMPYRGNVASVEIYDVGADQYVVLPQGNKIIQVGERPRGDGEASKEYDYSPRYSRAQLEEMARIFVAEHAPGVDLGVLTPRHGSKGAVEPNQKSGAYFAGKAQDTSFFFRWEDLREPSVSGGEIAFVQVGFTSGGTLLSYTNTVAP